MLLRRVLLHVRQQNWFAVLLDFVIVVVGVFIGVQEQTGTKHKSDERFITTPISGYIRKLAII